MTVQATKGRISTLLCRLSMPGHTKIRTPTINTCLLLFPALCFEMFLLALSGCGSPAPVAPTVTIAASPTSIVVGAPKTLTWSSANTTSCNVSGAWSGSQNTQGTATETPTNAGVASYALTCSGRGGSTQASASVTVSAPPAPTVTIAASPSTVTLGGTTSLTWTSTNATSCTASGAWIGSQNTSGTATETPVSTGTSTYTLTCTGAGGSANASAPVTVNAPPAPTILVSVSPSTISLGSSATLTWSSTYANACTATGAWSGTQATNGTEKVTPTAAKDYSYILACTGAGGSASSTATLTVTTPAPTVTISVAPASITAGGSAKLTWSSTAATGSTASGAWSGTQPTSGTATETPASVGTDTYTLSCTGSGGSASNSATLSLTAPPFGAYLYTLNSNLNTNGTGNITGYTVATGTGILTELTDAPYDTGLNAPDSLALDAQLNLVIAAGANGGSQGNGALSVMTLNPATGSLSKPTATPTTDVPTSITIGPQGKYLYMTSHSSDNVTAYSIASNGTLTELANSPISIPGSNRGAFCIPSADSVVYRKKGPFMCVGPEATVKDESPPIANW